MNQQQGFDESEEEEDEVAVGKVQYWHINAHVHGKAINISCGDATQRIKWLAHVAIGNTLCCELVKLHRDTNALLLTQLDGISKIARAGNVWACRQ
jgi:hypothetical protein